ncbi:kinesin-domain-containing protein [Gigaspora margarita]|uniref:Kinesin-like protein n=1 Tax=Gigaspora margarita TaxID=4874 RepID=A0A8H3X6U0_GIGMA|nr:kinesin-domain-containing protein [Gigaspora margarita]
MDNVSFNGEFTGSERSKKRRRSNNENSTKEGEKAINIQVVVRCRARIEREVAANSPIVVQATPREIKVWANPQDMMPYKTFTFDKVFGSDADQNRIFDTIVIPILHEVKAGYNCTLFAYGQTSTGKTFTMEGKLDICNGTLNPDAGVIPRSLYYLFDTLEAEQADFSVKISYIELYNEELKDLLSSDSDARQLKILDDSNRKCVLHGHEEVLIKSAEDGINVLKQGSMKRQVAQTNYNKNSSRSHSVFCITVHIKETMPDGEDLLKVGKFNLVDLAGSENISRTGAENLRAKEAGKINKSLLTLGRCINSLNEHNQHIPYRESKLTRLLQDSLGGHTKTCIIATISPAKLSYEETISTLDYAQRAKNILNKPVANQRVTKKALIKEYIGEIERLRADLLAAREKNGIYLSQDTYQSLVDENQSRKDENEELKKLNENLKQRVERFEQENSIINRKLLRQISINNHHQKVFQEFHQMMLSVTSQLEYKFNEIKSVHIGFGELMYNKAREFMERRENEISVIVKCIEERIDRSILQKDQIIQIFDNQEQIAINLSDELSKFREETLKLMDQKGRELLKSASTTFSTFQNELSNQFEKVRSYQVKFGEDLSGLMKTTQEHIASQNQAIVSFRNFTHETSNSQIDCMIEQKHLLTQLAEEDVLSRKSMEEEILSNVLETLKKYGDEHSTKVKSFINNVQDIIQKNVDSVKSFDEACTNVANDMNAANTSYLTNFNNRYDTSKENLLALKNENRLARIDTIEDNIFAQLDECKDAFKSKIISLDTFASSAVKETSELQKRHAQSFNSYATDVTQGFSEFQNQFLRTRTDSETMTKCVFDLNQANANATSGLYINFINQVQRSREEINSLSEKFNDSDTKIRTPTTKRVR